MKTHAPTTTEVVDALLTEAHEEGRQSVRSEVAAALTAIRREAKRARINAEVWVVSGESCDGRSPLWWGGNASGLEAAAKMVERLVP